MGIDAGGTKTAMTEQHLNDPKVGIVLHQVCGKAVTKHMGRDGLFQSSLRGGALTRPVDRSLRLIK